MRVLSLFDGAAGAYAALSRLGVADLRYEASEIDPDARAVAAARVPGLVDLGDVRSVRPDGAYDLLIGGSPCQSLSGANKVVASADGLNPDQKSGLFWDYLRIRDAAKPTRFALENVGRMSAANRDRISAELGVQPITIDAARITAQSRVRHYWTDIPDVSIPEIKPATVRDLLEPDDAVDPGLFVPADRTIVWFDEPRRSRVTTDCVGGLIQVGGVVSTTGKLDFGQGNRIYDPAGKGCGLNANSGGVGAKTGLYMTQPGRARRLSALETERMQGFDDDWTNVAGLSDGARKVLMGNSFSVPVVRHVLRGLANHVQEI